MPAASTPLGLPAGSIRALLTLLILTLFWLVLLLPDHRAIPMPPNIYLLIFMVPLFFSSHGRSIGATATGTGHPLHMPRGSLRALIILGSAAALAYLYTKQPEMLEQRLTPSVEAMQHWPLFMACLFGGFTFGHLFRSFPGHDAPWVQSVQAWFALMSMLLLVTLIVVQVFIAPTLKAPIDIAVFEGIVTAITAGYFGTRS